MNLHARLFLALGALSAASSVALGAAANHALAERLANTLAWFQTALQYQQFHALGLMIVGLVAIRVPSRWTIAAGWLMLAGTLLFSGNLYLRSLANFHALHVVTPFGGGAFILAWLALALGVLTAHNATHQ
jgi:uncharacterized membrane protein YgdD (TMEM256/DUF423 family)